MNTDFRDRFEDRLLTAILEHFDELAGDAPPARTAPVAAPGRDGARGGPRVILRRTGVGLLAGAAVAALAATGLTGLAGHAPEPARPAMLTAAYVVGHVQAAASQSSAVAYIRQSGPDGRGSTYSEQSWTRGVSQRVLVSDSRGRPASGYLETSSLSGTSVIAVDYHSRTWSRALIYPGLLQLQQARLVLDHGTGPALMDDPIPLRTVIARYHWAVLGEVTVDGQRTIHLRTENIAVFPDGLFVKGGIDTGGIGFSTELWVNAASYLLVRQIISYPAGRVFRADYRWLPPAPATLRLLTRAAAIPAGFVLVPGRPAFPIRPGSLEFIS
jgi:hypothetical protein